MPRDTNRPFWRSRWWMPAFALLLGLVMLAAFTIGGDTSGGLQGLGVMAAVALVFALGGRSETLSGLSGPGRDERWSMIDLRATATAGSTALAFAIGAWLWEVAHEREGSEFAQVAAVGGVAYLAAVAFFRWRS